MALDVSYIDYDREVWEKELEDYVPSIIYDMHVHMWSNAHRDSAPESGLMLEIGYQDHIDWAADLYPGREMHFLNLGTPIPGMDAEGHNDWCAEQLSADPDSAMNMMVTPDMTAEYVAAQADKYNAFGLKPYRTFAPDRDEARIRDFLPEHQIEVAHDKGLAITMHLSKRIGAADKENQQDLEEGDQTATGGAQTARPEDHQRCDELDGVIEQDAPLVDPGWQLMQIPAQRARQGLGFVVVDQAGQVPPAGIAAQLDEAGAEHDAVE